MKTSIIYKKNFITVSGEKQELKKALVKLISNVIQKEKKIFTSLDLIFCSDELIREYNMKYLDHDYETDIITFYDIDEEEGIEGELLISVDTVKSNSLRYKTSFNNELSRVVIHGLLHLCGYKDKTAAQKQVIRKKENYFLNIK
ncbi:MAG: rRNA maturation RNase YbeY [bacterium]